MFNKVITYYIYTYEYIEKGKIVFRVRLGQNRKLKVKLKQRNKNTIEFMKE